MLSFYSQEIFMQIRFEIFLMILRPSDSFGLVVRRFKGADPHFSLEIFRIGLRLPDTQVNHSMLPENCQRLFSGIGVKENDQNMREYSFSELDFLMTDAVPDIEEINPTLTIDYID